MKTILFISIILIVSSCCTMYSTRYQTVNINTEPQGACVYYKGSIVASTTPSTITILRKTRFLTIKKDGYETKETRLIRGVNPVIFLDLLLFYPVSIPIDFITGAAWKIKKNTTINLIKK